MRVTSCFGCHTWQPVILMKKIDKHKHFYLCKKCQEDLKQ